MTTVKFKLTYGGDKRSYTYSKIKESASDTRIFNTAIAFSRLRAGVHDNVVKVVETDILNA